MTFGKRFKKARMNRGLSQQKTAKLLGKTQQYIPILESGGVASPRGDFLKRAGELFGVSPIWLLYGDIDEPLPCFKSYVIPVIRWQDVVNWPSLTTTTQEELAMIKKGLEHCFVLPVIDDLMSTPQGPVTFNPSDLIIVDPAKTPESGHFVVASGDGYEVPVLKKYVVDGPNKLLMSLKDGIPAIVMDDSYSILGVVVQKQTVQSF